MYHFCFQTMWVYDREEEKLVQREINFVPGLYKIFDEILGMYFHECL